jgi:hypothetical protein
MKTKTAVLAHLAVILGTLGTADSPLPPEYKVIAALALLSVEALLAKLNSETDAAGNALPKKEDTPK